MVKDFTLTITAVAQRLSSVLADPTVGGKDDIPYRQVILSTETDCFIGGSSTLTTSNYGKKVFVDTNATPPLVLGPIADGSIKLSDVWVIGTSGKLHILGVAY
jgi:hypothetical protein